MSSLFSLSSPLRTSPFHGSSLRKPLASRGEESSLRSKLDIPYNPDCFLCKVMGVLTLYGAGFLVLSNTKKVPTSNKAGKFAMGLFGVGLLATGTMRMFVR